MRKVIISSLVLAVLLGGCISVKNKEWSAVGGSKADGVVRLAYEYTYAEEAITDENQARRLAAQRCSSWGYEGAEPFGGILTTCQMFQPSLFGGTCLRTTVMKEFQCIGSPGSIVVNDTRVNVKSTIIDVKSTAIDVRQNQIKGETILKPLPAKK